jgi:hypothetical protein
LSKRIRPTDKREPREEWNAILGCDIEDVKIEMLTDDHDMANTEAISALGYR